jgi:glycine cleavage system aminomethyltransferase T
VGFVVNDNNAPIPLESHLVLDGEQMTGRVTSCNYSPTLGKPIGLAYVQPHCTEPGSQIRIKSSAGVMVTANVVALPFYDPKTLASGAVIMTELNPDQALRRSPLYRRHQQLDARFEQLGDAVVVNAYSDTGMEPRLAISLGLADLSCLPRTGYKGPNAPNPGPLLRK